MENKKETYRCLYCWIEYQRYPSLQKLGRLLEEDEEIHHIDGNSWNNNITNLAALKIIEHRKLHREKKKEVPTSLMLIPNSVQSQCLINSLRLHCF